MEGADEILERLWNGRPVTYIGKYFQLHEPGLRQGPRLPPWRSVISQSSFTECGRRGVPMLRRGRRQRHQLMATDTRIFIPIAFAAYALSHLCRRHLLRTR